MGGVRLTYAPVQIPGRCLLGLAGVTGILSLERALQCLARIETVFRQLHRIFVIDHRVLVGESMKFRTFTVGAEGGEY